MGGANGPGTYGPRRRRHRPEQPFSQPTKAPGVVLGVDIADAIDASELVEDVHALPVRYRPPAQASSDPSREAASASGAQTVSEDLAGAGEFPEAAGTADARVGGDDEATQLIFEPLDVADAELDDDDSDEFEEPAAEDAEQGGIYGDAGEHDPQPTMWGFARRGRLTAPAVRSILNRKTLSSNELNIALAPLKHLQPGQTALTSFIARSDPGFRDELKNEVKRLKGEQRFESKPGVWGRAKRVARILGWLGSRLVLGDKSPVPWKRQRAGAIKLGVEGQEVLDAAKQKLEADQHLAIQSYIAVFGSNPGSEAEKVQLQGRLDDMAQGFSPFNTAEQALVFDDPCDVREVTTALMPKRVNERFSPPEAAALVSLPDKHTKVDGVSIRRATTIAFRPEHKEPVRDLLDLRGRLIPLGYVEKGTDAEFVHGFRVADLDQHAAFFGATGSGKSTYSTWIFYACVKAGYPVILLDPAGELAMDCLDIAVNHCPERIDDVLYCDLADENYAVAFNPLDVRRENIPNAVERITNLLGPHLNFTAASAPASMRVLQQVLWALAEANLSLPEGTKLTLVQVPDFLTDQELRWAVAQHSTRLDILRKFEPAGEWDTLGEGKQAELSAVILSRFDSFAQKPLFANTFGSPENKLDLGKLVAEKRILIINQARLTTNSELGNLLGGMVIPTLMETMHDWGRRRDPKTHEYVGHGCRAIVDEAHLGFAGDPHAATALAVTRKWDLGFVFLTQLPSQYQGKMSEAILGNTVTKGTFRLDPSEARALSESLSGDRYTVLPQNISGMPNHTMIARPLSWPGPDQPPGPGEPVLVHTPPPIRDVARAQFGEPSKQELARRERLREEVMQRSYAELYNERRKVEALRELMPRELTSVPRSKLAALSLRELNKPSDAAVEATRERIDALVDESPAADLGDIRPFAAEQELPIEDMEATGGPFVWPELEKK